VSIYTNVKLYFNFIFIIHVTFFNFEAQIIYMWSFKLFKVSEILHVATFDITCSSKFASNCVHYSLPTPNTLHEFSITPRTCAFWLEAYNLNYIFFYLVKLIKMTYLVIYQIEHLVTLNKIDHLGENGQGVLVKWDI